MIFDYITQAWYFYRKNFFSLLALAVPFAAISTVVTLVFGLPIEFTAADQPPILRPETIALTVILSTLYTGAKALLVQQLVLGHGVNVPRLISTALANWPRLLILLFIMQLITGMGLLLFILPGLWVWTRLCFAPFILLFENQSIAQSLQQSISRTFPRGWQILGAFVAVGGPLLLVIQVIGGLLLDSLGDTSAVAIVLITAAENILFSLITVMFFRFYELEKEAENRP